MSDDRLTETTVESVVAYQGKIINLRVDTVRLPGGRVATREIAEHSDSICVVPVDEDGNVLLVRQFRKPTETILLEVPAGGVEAGEGIEETVQRELQEEVGYQAGTLQHLAGFWLAPGWCTEYMHAYLATDLTPATRDADDDENIEVERVPLERALELIASGGIQDAKSIASLLLAARVLN